MTHSIFLLSTKAVCLLPAFLFVQQNDKFLMPYPLTSRVNAVNYGAFARRGAWSTPNSALSLELMVERLNPTHVVLSIVAFQKTAQSTDVDYTSIKTVDIQEIREVVERLHRAGLRVILKPMVDVLDGTWRAYICFFDVDVPTEPTWAQWFASYTKFQLHFARFAQEMGVEMFVVGCEMCMAQHREQEWRKLISDVRHVYTGLVTYNADKFQEEKIDWWDACDLISSSAYYPIDCWSAAIERIERIVARFNKPFVFMEAGCRNVEGAIDRPGKHDYPGARSDLDQVHYYTALFSACEASGFVSGVCIWDWPADLSSLPELRYCPLNRPAEKIIRAQFDRTSPHQFGQLRKPLPRATFRPLVRKSARADLLVRILRKVASIFSRLGDRLDKKV